MEKMKVAAFDNTFARLLRELLARIPAVKVASVRAAGDVDFRIALKVAGKAWTLVAEVIRLGQPQEVRGAVARLRQVLPDIPGTRKYPVLLAPFVSPASARLCQEAGAGYADLSGNVMLSFGPVYIEIQGKENAHKRHKEAKTLFSPKSQRILRILLQGPLRTWKISQLAEAADVSLGWTSALKQQLVAREWARDVRGGVLLTQPAAVLDAWAGADDWGGRTEVKQFSLLQHHPERIAEEVRVALGRTRTRYALTQWIAGWMRQPYTLPPIVTAYVEAWPDLEALESKLGARQVSQGGRLWLAKPKDEGVFNPIQKINGYPLVSDAQIYLDLIRAGQRGDEQASELRKRQDFSGGWT